MFRIIRPYFVQSDTRRRALPTDPLSRLPLVAINGAATDLMAEEGWKVLAFWSPSCPCVQSCQEFSLTPLWKRYGDGAARSRNQPRVRFYAVASNTSTLRYERVLGRNEERVRLFLSGSPEQRPPYPLLLDRRHAVADLLDARTTPETFLISPTGKVLFRGDPDDSAEVRRRTGREGVTKRYLLDALRLALMDKPILMPVAPVTGCEIDRTS